MGHPVFVLEHDNLSVIYLASPNNFDLTEYVKGKRMTDSRYIFLDVSLFLSLSHSGAGSLSDSLLGSVSDGAKRAMPSLSRGADKYLEGFPTAQNHPPTDEPADIAGDKQGSEDVTKNAIQDQ